MKTKMTAVWRSNCCNAIPEWELASDHTGRCSKCKEGALFYKSMEPSTLGATLKWKRAVKVEVLTKQIFTVRVNNLHAFEQALTDIRTGIRESNFMATISGDVDNPFDARGGPLKVYTFFKPPSGL